MFRAQSLDKLSSPDRLDQLLRVVRPQAWVVLLCTGLGLAWAAWWGFTGRVPITIEGVAILVRPQMVVPIEATVDGRVDEVRFEQGQLVYPPPTPKGSGTTRPVERDRLGEARGAEGIAAGCAPDAVREMQRDEPVPDWSLFVLRVPEIESDLRKERERLRFVCERNAALQETEKLYHERQRVVLRGGLDPDDGTEVKGQLPLIEERIQMFEALLEKVEKQSREFETEGADDEATGAGAPSAERMREDLVKQLARLEDGKELIGPSEQDLFRIKSQIHQLGIDSQVFSLRKLELDKSRGTLFDWIATLTLRRDDLEAAWDQLELDRFQKDHERETEVGDIQRRIRWLVQQRENGYVPLPQSSCDECAEDRLRAVERGQEPERLGAGKLVSITTARGEMVQTGDLLARVEKIDPHVQTEAIAFIPVALGKKINYREGDVIEARVSPTSIEKERHGSLMGRIKGEPSEHPVTVDMAGNILGDRELAEKLLGDGIYIMVAIELDRECPCGCEASALACPDECEDSNCEEQCRLPSTARHSQEKTRLMWSGKKPPQDPTVGTTCEVRITTEWVRPVELLFEFFGD